MKNSSPSVTAIPGGEQMEGRRYSELSAVLQQALVLSKVKESERVVLVHPSIGYNPRIVEALRIALNNLGADFIRLELPPKANGLRQVRPLGPFGGEILKAADMVVRVSPRPPLTPDISMYDANFSEVLFGGARWLDFMIDEDSIWRLFPSQRLIDRTYRGAERMAKAEVVRVTSEAGTDLTVRKTGRTAVARCGVADVPGRWDNYGFGHVACAPLEVSAVGTLVVSPGDAAGQIERVAIDRERIVYRFEEGRIVAIEGGASAELLSRHLQSYNDPNVYRIAHIGWGTQDQAVWGGPNFTTADWEGFYGNMMVHFGVNAARSPAPYAALGGSIPPGTNHWGGAHLGHSLWIDDEQILDRGRIVPQDLQ
jgi:2,5-dihydroxypyridine 5,6-dioxygenase